MKKLKGFSTAAIVTIVVVIAILIIGTVIVINRNNSKVDYTTYVGTAIIEGTEDNGQIADHVRGNADAPVIIHEFANFQCNHCADLNPFVEQAIAESNGQLAVVFRNLTWSSFQNSRAAAAAAEAAGLQGYWEPYANLLFENQAEWFSATGSDRTALFEKYFTEATDGNGDLEKFRADVGSDLVAKKIDFDNGLAQQFNVEGTPAFFVDGQFINMAEGGDLTFSNGKTLHYDAPTENEDFLKIIQDIITTKTSS